MDLFDVSKIHYSFLESKTANIKQPTTAIAQPERDERYERQDERNER